MSYIEFCRRIAREKAPRLSDDGLRECIEYFSQDAAAARAAEAEALWVEAQATTKDPFYNRPWSPAWTQEQLDAAEAQRAEFVRELHRRYTEPYQEPLF